jgi:hypothetical protein
MAQSRQKSKICGWSMKKARFGHVQKGDKNGQNAFWSCLKKAKNGQNAFRSCLKKAKNGQNAFWSLFIFYINKLYINKIYEINSKILVFVEKLTAVKNIAGFLRDVVRVYFAG